MADDGGELDVVVRREPEARQALEKEG
jgi:hypothetical protein